MAEIVEVEVGQACSRTGSIKGMSYVIPPMAGRIMEDPRYVVPPSKPTEQAPQGFIEWQRPCLAVLRLLQPDKSVEHIHQVPSEASSSPFRMPV
jgi:hypothetical protein